MTKDLLIDLPGADLILGGLADLAAHRETPEALLVAIGYPRLHSLGLGHDLANCLPSEPESRLYRLLGNQHGEEAHSQYNALIRRLIRFEHALERRFWGR